MSLPHRLKCAETWAGNEEASNIADLPGLTVWVHSTPFGSDDDDFRRDSDLFLECARDPETQRRTGLAMARGFQTHEEKWRWHQWWAA